MSQEDVRQLLLESGGDASISELSDLASKQFPRRTLSGYLSERLESMKQKGLVQTREMENETIWVLTEKGRTTTLETKIQDLGTVTDEDSLAEADITISNIVGSLTLGRRFDLNALSEDLPNTDYHPERYHSTIFRPDDDSSITIIIPASGRISITGAASKDELIDSTEMFLESLGELGIKIDKSTDDIYIQNIVANFDFDREFDLTTLSIDLGMEQTEYEPEQFPGIIYRSAQNATILIFNSGKCVITGAKSYSEIFKVLTEIYNEMSDLGVELDYFQDIG